MKPALIKRLERTEKAAAAMPICPEVTRADWCARLLELGIELTPEETELAKTGDTLRFYESLPPSTPMHTAELNKRLRELGIEM